MTRRTRGEGSLFYDRHQGAWVGQVDIGWDPATGKRQRRKVSAATRPEAAARLRTLTDELRRSGTVGRQDTTVAHVIQDLLAAPPPEWRSQVTSDVNARHARRIIAGLGRAKLVRLTARDVEWFLFALAEGGKDRGPLSASTITATRALLARAIRRAQRDGLVSRNAALEAVLPRARRKRSKALTLDQVAALLAQDVSPWWRAYMLAGITLGLRPGELLGLRWEDVDFANGVIRVRKSLKQRREPDGRWVLYLDELKTERSRRSLAMPTSLASVLRAHKTAQAQQRLQAQAASWADHGLVFATASGRPAWPQGVRQGFCAKIRAAGIPGDWYPHEMRHTFVSVLSAAGVDIEEIADAAGHINSSVTRTVYRHVIADRVNVAGAAAMDRILGSESGS